MVLISFFRSLRESRVFQKFITFIVYKMKKRIAIKSHTLKNKFIKLSPINPPLYHILHFVINVFAVSNC